MVLIFISLLSKNFYFSIFNAVWIFHFENTVFLSLTQFPFKIRILFYWWACLCVHSEINFFSKKKIYIYNIYLTLQYLFTLTWLSSQTPWIYKHAFKSVFDITALVLICLCWRVSCPSNISRILIVEWFLFNFKFASKQAVY